MTKKNKPMTRSENMTRVKCKNTKPEIYLRKLLWHMGASDIGLIIRNCPEALIFTFLNTELPYL